MMSRLNPPSFIPKGDRRWQQVRGTPHQKWLKMIGPLLVSVPFLLLFLFLPVTLSGPFRYRPSHLHQAELQIFT